MPEAWREPWQPLPASEEVGLARRAQHAARARSLNLLLRSPKGVIVVRSPFVSPLSRRAVSYGELTRARAILGRGGRYSIAAL